MKESDYPWVEIASYTFPSDAQVLRSLLEAEGIESLLENEYAVLPSAGSVKLKIKEEDMSKALEIMKKGGFDIDDEPEA